MARADEDGGWAAPERLGRTHGRVDPEAAGDVVGGGDDSTAVWITADDERPLSQLGILELLDGGEERVEVEVGEDRHRRRHPGRLDLERSSALTTSREATKLQVVT